MKGLRKMCKNCFSLLDKHNGKCPVCGWEKGRKSAYEAISHGTKLAGRYVIGGCIGRGGFGITYLAYDMRDEKTVAVKEYFPVMLAKRGNGQHVIPNDEKKAEQFNIGAEKFFDEAELVRRFNGNPNIVSIYECFYENNTAYYVMEYLDGISLENYVTQYGVLNSAQTLYLADKITMALVVLHSGTALHRDISPDNVMLCRDGSVKLIDFGAARLFFANKALGYTVITKVGFSPMEQYSQDVCSDVRSDIYSLAMVLYYALTGRIPKAFSQRMEDDSEFAQSIASAGNGLQNIIRKAAALFPSERYKSAEEFRNALLTTEINEAVLPVPKEYNPLKKEETDYFFSEKKRGKKLFFAVSATVLAYVLFTICVLAAIPHIVNTPWNSQASPNETPLNSTSPSETQPNETQPNETQSNETQPNETQPNETQPNETQPNETQPNETQPNETPTNATQPGSPSLNGTVTLALDSEYAGHFCVGGKISSSWLRRLGGDVEVTLFIKPWEGMSSDDIHGLIPVNASDKSMLQYLTSAKDLWADENGWITIEKGNTSLSFVLSQEGVESLGEGALGFETYNLIITSAVLKPSEKQKAINLNTHYKQRNAPYYVVDNEGGRVITAVLNEYARVPWGAYESQSIPKNAFLEFEGDVKVTIELEDIQGSTDNWRVVYIRNSGTCYNVFEADVLVPDIKGANGKRLMVCDEHYGILPDAKYKQCIFIIPNSIKEKMSGGIFFQSINMRVTNVRLETYYDEYRNFIQGGK